MGQELSREEVVPRRKPARWLGDVDAKALGGIHHVRAIQRRLREPTALAAVQCACRLVTDQKTCPSSQHLLELLIDFGIQKRRKADFGAHRPVEHGVDGRADLCRAVPGRCLCQYGVESVEQRLEVSNLGVPGRSFLYLAGTSASISLKSMYSWGSATTMS